MPDSPKHCIFLIETTSLPLQCKKYKHLSQFHEIIRPAFKVFFTEDLNVEWVVTEDEQGAIFVIDGYIPGDSIPVIHYWSQAIFMNNSCCIKGAHSTQQNPCYDHALTTDQKGQLSLGLIQRFLRGVGSLLDNDQMALTALIKAFMDA
mmetsp:Transcript_27727/g.41959  ORF Transcript_27727/g.41959 Transcript_27727/m.41959 type:complete len:148 (+) Transcript_27727:531-974(+)